MQQGKPSKTTSPVRRLSWKLAPIAVAGLLVIPIVIAILLIQLTGAHLLDGLFGVYRNTPTQTAAVNTGIILTFAAPILSLGFSIYFAGSRSDLPLQKRLLPLALVIPIILLIALYLFAPEIRPYLP